MIENGAAAKPIYYNSISEKNKAPSSSKTPKEPEKPDTQPENIADTGAFRIDIPDALKNDPNETKQEHPDNLKSAVFGSKAPVKQSENSEKDVFLPVGNFEVTYDDDLPDEPEEDNTPAPAAPETVPLTIWQDIISTLPMSIKLGIQSTNAYIRGNEVLIEGGSLAVGLATSDYRDDIRKAASKAIGRNVTVSAYESENDSSSLTPDNTDKVSNFLDLARSKGITIKEQ